MGWRVKKMNKNVKDKVVDYVSWGCLAAYIVILVVLIAFKEIRSSKGLLFEVIELCLASVWVFLPVIVSANEHKKNNEHNSSEETTDRSCSDN